ncbi:PilW family protein [Stutzerimonas stutzeri]|uniref:Pilus assembly protein PilW n=1 Tax=Stutzerimonas stutzeri TaxID=316 RepID=A0A2N8REB6_STUST|nr:PilW family protein [Stutzerimonas stutzeri]MCQ4254375.1 PilW family protein [Stutzerimonas stutzeri]PNF59426.1 pilus assembly protein PilW [Stutzerimonas stutzeri]
MTLSKYQSGLSLVELMIALLISSFLILGVTQIYIDNKRSYLFQQNQAENIEASRYTLLVLQQEVGKAGFRRRPDETLEDAFPAFSAANCSFVAGEVAKVTNTPTASLCIRYHPMEPTDRDCLGNLPEKASEISKPYTSAVETIVERLYLDQEDKSLKCTVASTGKNGSAIRAAQTAELITGVAGLRFESGIPNATDARAVQQYTTDPTTKQVLSLRYTALMKSGNQNVRDAVDIDTALGDWKAFTNAPAADTAAIKAADKGELYQVMQSTIMLRNLMP